MARHVHFQALLFRAEKYLGSISDPRGGKITKRAFIFVLLLIAAPEIAVADPELKLGGILDICVNRVNTGASLAVIQESACQTGSRLRLSGGENISEGLKAIFMLEAGLNIPNGTLAQGGRIFGRQAWAGAQSSLGTITFGRHYSPMDDFGEEIGDAFWGGYNGSFLFLQGVTAGKLDLLKTGSAFSSNSLVDWSGSNGEFSVNQAFGLRVDNSIKWVVPVLDYFVVTTLYGFGERLNSDFHGRQSGLALRYTNGPFQFAIGYHQIKGLHGVVSFDQEGSATFRPNSGDFTQRSAGTAASYNFGSLHLYGNIEQSRFQGFQVIDYGISSRYQLHPKWDLTVGTVQKRVRDFGELNAGHYAGSIKYLIGEKASAYLSYARISNSGNEQQGAAYIPTYALTARPGSSTDSLMIGLRYDLRESINTEARYSGSRID